MDLFIYSANVRQLQLSMTRITGHDKNINLVIHLIVAILRYIGRHITTCKLYTTCHKKVKEKIIKFVNNLP